MNNDLISRKDAKYLVKQTAKHIAAQNGTVDEITYALKIVYDDIDGIPTIDAQPVRHGRWIEYTYWIGAFGQIYSKCSECGTTYSGRKGSRGDGKGGKFCEECGAKMDGENECSDG